MNIALLCNWLRETDTVYPRPAVLFECRGCDLDCFVEDRWGVRIPILPNDVPDLGSYFRDDNGSVISLDPLFPRAHLDQRGRSCPIPDEYLNGETD